MKSIDKNVVKICWAEGRDDKIESARVQRIQIEMNIHNSGNNNHLDRDRSSLRDLEHLLPVSVRKVDIGENRDRQTVLGKFAGDFAATS